MRFRDRVVDCERSVGCGGTIIHVAAKSITQARLSEGEERPSFSIIGIDLDRSTANSHDAFFAARVAVVAGDPKVAREKIQIIGFGILGAALLDCLLLFG